jgi:pilus assembly protein CpaF
MEIMECETLPDGMRRCNTLYRYNITENRLDGGRFVIGGRHEAVSPISAGLRKRFLENGMPKDILEKLTGKESESA